ncbi:MAG: signal peptidase I [Bdellovibrionaceae bacterium]|nr:signal peptidase I [Pseudobdellovibrionaceae bacterium]
MLSDKQLEEAGNLEDELSRFHKQARGKAKKDEQEAFAGLQKRVLKLFPKEKDEGTIDLVETLFFTAVIGLGIMCFFARPFKIPTDSMKPTLWGVATDPVELDEPMPNPLARILDMALFGTFHHRLVAGNDGIIEGIRQSDFLGIPLIKQTHIRIGGHTHTLWCDQAEFAKGIVNNPIERGQQVRKGEVLARFKVRTGDQLFVERFSNHFRRPGAGEVFVFTTHHIRGIEDRNRQEGSPWGQYYIKRCVGVPGDELSIDPPYLKNHGQTVNSRDAFQRIYSKQNGYNGYTFASGSASPLGEAGDTVTLRDGQFWAMGDNSFNSLDSRYWGAVPEKNLIGTAVFVYWPFGSRWGLIR